jgi:hypothetical protein
LLLGVRLLLEGKALKGGAMVRVDCIVEEEHTAHIRCGHSGESSVARGL